MADREKKYKEIPLTGRWITAVDPAAIDVNFQTLTNLRYTDNGIRGIAGMSKINTTPLPSYPKIRNIFQFRKHYPSLESHVLVQAYNSGETESKLFEITAAPPAQGNFGSALHTDAPGADGGRFDIAPDGALAYCNGKETLVWGGNEFRCSKFIHYEPGGTFKYDYTDRITNSLSSAGNVVNLAEVPAGIDSDVMLLLHLNNNVTDSSPTTPHTVTNNNVTFSTSPVLFGSHCGSFNGSSAYLVVPDNADFDFSGGNFTIDFRMRITDYVAARPIFYQQTDASNYVKLYVNTSGNIVFTVVAAGSEVVNVTSTDVQPLNTWIDVELVESGNNWYLFVDGRVRGYSSDTDRLADYTGDVQIGYDGATYFKGYMDEIRISDVARHTSEFEPISAEYSLTTTAAYFYVGAVRPLDGIKFYVSSANTAAGSISVDYWSGSAWAAVSSLVDGTASGGASLAVTGVVSFSSTSGVAKVKAIDQTVLYWYRVTVTAADTSTGIYQVTLSDVFQALKDIWDGETRTCADAQLVNVSYNDNTLNVFEEDYYSGNTATYMTASSLPTSGNILVGFTERQIGLQVTVVDGKGNSNAASMIVAYWNGKTWVIMGSIDDGTLQGGKSFSKSGVILWPEVARTLEFPTTIGNGEPLYYYRISFTGALSTNTYIDFIGGIPAQREIYGYKFPMFAHNRLFLVSEHSDKKNTVLVSAEHTNCVFNGVDSVELAFNDDMAIVAGSALYSQFGSNLYNMTVFFKERQTWALIGNGPSDWVQYQVSDKIGCVAPLTVQTAHVGFELAPGQSKNVAIWQSGIGIHLFDGREIKPLHGDIADWFDERYSYSINRDMIDKSTSFFDEGNQEYHWCFASGAATALDKEFVFDLKRQRWFNVDRTSGKRIQIGCVVKDSSGNSYNYGAIDTGYAERLENGTTMDGTAIAYIIRPGDMAFAGMMVRTMIRMIKLIMVAKTTTINSVTCTHYGDGKTVGDTAITLSPVASGKRIAQVEKTTGFGSNVFHSLEFSISTSNESFGFEPLFIGIAYKPIDEDSD